MALGDSRMANHGGRPESLGLNFDLTWRCFLRAFWSALHTQCVLHIYPSIHTDDDPRVEEFKENSSNVKGHQSKATKVIVLQNSRESESFLGLAHTRRWGSSWWDGHYKVKTFLSVLVISCSITVFCPRYYYICHKTKQDARNIPSRLTDYVILHTEKLV